MYLATSKKTAWTKLFTLFFSANGLFVYPNSSYNSKYDRKINGYSIYFGLSDGWNAFSFDALDEYGNSGRLDGQFFSDISG